MVELVREPSCATRASGRANSQLESPAARRGASELRAAGTTATRGSPQHVVPGVARSWGAAATNDGCAERGSTQDAAEDPAARRGASSERHLCAGMEA
eukprot:8404921-Alexandrium_andersonii.AAC.1